MLVHPIFLGGERLLTNAVSWKNGKAERSVRRIQCNQGDEPCNAYLR